MKEASEAYAGNESELDELQEKEDEDLQLVPIGEIDVPGIQSLISTLSDEMREEYKITKKAAKKLARRICNIKHGAALEIPMQCLGGKCPISRTCPLLEEDVAPIGMPCPIERYMSESIRSYYIKDLHVDHNNFVHMTQVNDLVECEILDQRMSAYLDKDGWFEDVVTGVDSDGSPIFRKDAAASYRMKMQMKGRKDKLLRTFLATREMQAKYNLSSRRDPSNYASDLLAAGERLKDEAVDADIVGDDND